MREKHRHAPQDPYPVAPLNGAVVDGTRVSLQWEPSDGATSYAVDIAEDPEFQNVIFAQELPASATQVTLGRSFPTDDRTLYWRVSAANAHGWSEGERVESFTSGTSEQVGHFPDPDEAEPFGPIEALLRHVTNPGSVE
jgi:hypothetical protein